ncbi:hypothetical protein LOK49_LG06G01959 [Camellia lanceoleosa]|uniref:Uncharacterized protein n=1 Tax=Camellia lanceoleosa TaxID=1840588 RepID=A0ACC0HCY3_9ERIC|nr:hypothetical protein LOK49_LG06G01959 [Camellia lanceoleosa]
METASLCNTTTEFRSKRRWKTDSSKAFLSAWDGACGSAYPATIYVPQAGAAPRNRQALPEEQREELKEYSFIPFCVLFNARASTSSINQEVSSSTRITDLQEGWIRMIISIIELLEADNFDLHCFQSLTDLRIQQFKQRRGQQINITEQSDVPHCDQQLQQHQVTRSEGPGTTNLWIESIACDLGHSISIGSLGKDSQESGVQNVTVKTVTFKGTQNGLRIKTWAKPSSGFVRGVLFQHGTMVIVQNPVIIDQNYCPGNTNCPNQVSGVKINDVTYQDIHGTSATSCCEF